MRYFPHSPATITYMLESIGKRSLDDLFSSIPENAKLQFPLDLPKKLSELEIKRILAKFSSHPQHISFLGAGACPHFVPEWISQQLLRAEWYTSYTPYQPEASQGTLQAIFEFQSMVASLFGLDIANASMYDGATALMEALLMAVRATGRRTIILAKSIHPDYQKTVETYFSMAELYIRIADFDRSGVTDLKHLYRLMDDHDGDIAAIAIQSPNFFGRIEDVSRIGELAHGGGALLIGSITDMSAAAILPSLGSCGADIAVGEGLGLLGSLSLGGPGVGLFSCKKALLRQMPGRLVGETVDQRGNRGYVLTLSTREQHIRREKATSNICTNHNLMALAFAMSLSAYGRAGFLTLAKTNIRKTISFRRRIVDKGLPIAFLGPHYNETVLAFSDQALLDKRLAIARANGMIAGLNLENFFPELKGHLLVATTELHDDEQLGMLADILCGERDD